MRNCFWVKIFDRFRSRVRPRRVMKKIGFLGASVTAQTYEREAEEVTGYVEVFKNEYAKGLGFEDVIVYAYAGNRISDAGLICAAEILNQCLDVVILEVTIEDRSRGSDFSDKHLNHLCNIFTSNNVFPIFLALPEPGEHRPSNLAYQRISRFAETKGIPLCIVELPPSVELTDLCRDGVHTNAKGADRYASALGEFIGRMVDTGWPQITPNPDSFTFQVQRIQMSGSSDFQTITIKNESPDREGGSLSIIQRQSIGKHSPVIDIEITGLSGDSLRRQISIWDPYCHYARESYINLVELARTDFSEIIIHVSSKLPDYSSCRRDFDFTAAQANRCMRSDQPFWVISEDAIELSIRTDTAVGDDSEVAIL